MGPDDIMVLLHNIITYYYYFGRAFNCLLLPWQVLAPYNEECGQGSPCVLFNLSSSVIMDYGPGKQYYVQCMTWWRGGGLLWVRFKRISWTIVKGAAKTTTWAPKLWRPAHRAYHRFRTGPGQSRVDDVGVVVGGRFSLQLNREPPLSNLWRRFRFWGSGLVWHCIRLGLFLSWAAMLYWSILLANCVIPGRIAWGMSNSQ